MLTKTPIGFVVALGILFPITTRAQGARDYLNTPINAATYFIDVVHTRAETAPASDVPLPNNLTVSRVRAITLLWSFPMAGRYAGIAVSGSRTRVRGEGPNGSIETSGFSDPGITFHANIFGAPAVSKEEFASAVPQTSSGFHFTVNPPAGSYDRNNPVNTGANRWAFTPLVNLTITPDKGVSWVDLYASGRFFTNNNEFQGTGKLSQKPIGIFTAQYSHNIGRRMWASFGGSYDTGGETSVNNLSQDNAANGFRPSVAFSSLIWKVRLTVRYELTASTPNAAPTNGLLSIRLSGFLF